MLKNKNSNKNKVVVTAANVEVIGKTQQKSKQPKPRKTRNGPSKKSENTLGQATGQMAPKTAFALMDQGAEGFIESYVDPCGTHRSGLDIKKIPDGAFPMSAVAEYRFIDTIPAPGRDLASVEPQLMINMSQLYILTPLLRAPCILLVNLLSQEFSDAIMAGFAKAWANLPTRESGQFPNWVSFAAQDETPTTNPVNYFTVLTPDTLSSLDTPSDLGISKVLKSWRIVSQGISAHFNVPDLVNQATAVMSRVSADIANVSPVREHVRGYDEFYLHSEPPSVTNRFAISAVFPSGGVNRPPINILNALGGLPTASVTSDVNFRNSSGSFTISVGEDFQYIEVASQVFLLNISTGSQLLVRDWTTNPLSTRMYVREPLDDDTIPIGEVNNTMTQVTLPIVQQKDMLAQIVSSTEFLMKDYEGVYLPNSIWKPIFEPQTATAYRKILFVNDSSDLSDLDDPTVGWFDSYDKNFGFAVTNIQGMSQAAAPLIKVIRTDEQIPAQHSIVGAYTTRASTANPVALTTATSMVDRLPMGYPVDFNDFGKLFNLVRTALKKMPVALAHALNIASEVQSAIDDVETLDYTSNNPRRTRVTRGRG
nr:structural protein [Tolivirales sp.]